MPVLLFCLLHLVELGDKRAYNTLSTYTGVFMECIRICNLKEKQVINTNNCKVLGYVADVEFDICTCCIKSLVVPGPPKFLCFFGYDCEYVIPCECIVNIGKDVILVNVCEEKIRVKL